MLNDRRDEGRAAPKGATSCWQVELIDVAEDTDSDRTDESGVCNGERIRGEIGDAANGESGVTSPPSLEMFPTISVSSSSTVAW